jgi:cathepsin A (carboxypeptidase C)
MACENDYHPLVSPDTCQSMRDSWPSCEKMLQDCQDKKTADVCNAAGDYCNGMYLGPVASTGMNLYDVRGTCERNDDLCYSIFDGVQTYLNKNEVQKMLGVPAIKYESCSMDVNNKFGATGDPLISHQNEIVDLLQNNVRVLLYAGDADYLCNWKSVQAVAKDMDWTYKAQFNAAETSSWYPTPHPKPLGDLTTYKNLSFLKIFKSGHYIPLNKPEVIYTVASNWVQDNLY